MILALRVVGDRVEAGRKARELARLLAVGLPVLDGLVVFPGDGLDEVVDLASRALGPGPYAVRSSSMLEDTEAGSAAGLYESRTGVTQAELVASIVAVRASAARDVIFDYLAQRGLESRPIAVLLQRDLHPCTLGVARSTDDGFLVEERPSSLPEWGDVEELRLHRDDDHPLAALLRRVAAVQSRSFALEYASTATGLVILQARPVSIVRASYVGPVVWPPGRWRLDAEHNPDPLSAAQAGLVALVDGKRFGSRTKTIGGYLYVREDAPVVHDAGGSTLRRFAESLEPQLRAELAAAADAPLHDALSAYRRVMRRYAEEVRPSVGAARGALDDLLERALHTRLAAHADLLAGSGGATTARDAALYALGRAPTPERLREYLARFGAYAPAWDVSIASDDEDPAGVLAAAARRARGPDPSELAAAASARATAAAASLRARLSVDDARAFDRHLAKLRDRSTLAESDDLLFYEGQRLVRRALLRRAAELVAEGRLATVEQVFEVPLDALSDATAPLRELAAAGLHARLMARQQVAPYRLVDRVARLRLPDGEVLRGRGAGGSARGPAYVLSSLTQPIGEVPPGAVLIVPAALPSLAPHLSRIAALVTEHGGLLSHALTLAREIGLPAVVGVAGATAIPPGVEVYVDGDRGRVLLLGRSR